MRVAPLGRSPRLERRAAGFIATRTLGASPGVRMSWSEMWTWKADTPASVPAGARISAGKSGKVARSLPNTALDALNRSPVSCIPSPESPAKRTTTRSSCRGRCGRASVVVTRPRAYRRADASRRLPVALPARLAPRARPASRDRDGRAEVDVLDRMDERGALVHRALEGLAAHDEPLAACPLVDHRGAHRLGQVSRPLGLASRVDEADPAGVAVHDLPPGEVDGVVRGQLVVDERVGLPEAEHVVAAVGLRLLLLDDVGLDGHADVVGLAREVGRDLVVHPVLLEG